MVRRCESSSYAPLSWKGHPSNIYYVFSHSPVPVFIGKMLGKHEEVADDFYDERRRLQVAFSVYLVDHIDCVKLCLNNARKSWKHIQRLIVSLTFPLSPACGAS